MIAYSILIIICLIHAYGVGGDRVPSHLLDPSDPDCSPERLSATCLSLCGGRPHQVKFCPKTCAEWTKKPIQCDRSKRDNSPHPSTALPGWLRPAVDLLTRLKAWLGFEGLSSARQADASGTDEDGAAARAGATASSTTGSDTAAATKTAGTGHSGGRFAPAFAQFVVEADLARHKLPTVKYRHSELGKPKFLRKLTRDRVPVRLSNLPDLKKENIMRWTPERLANRIPKPLATRYREADGLFSVGCCSVFPALVSEVFDPSRTGFYHLASRLETLGERIQKDFTKRSLHFLQSYLDDVDFKNLWLATHNSTTPMHYDPFENFIIQVYGHRRITLAPTGAFRSLYVHPKGHVRHRQAQADFAHPDYDRFPRLADLTRDGAFDTANFTFPLTFITEPGDVLYIPAYWFHQVTAVGPSIAVNRWHVSHLSRAMDEAWNVQLPFNNQFAPLEIVATLREFVLQVVTEVLYSDDSHDGGGATTAAESFVVNLLNSRYRPVYGPEPVAGVDVFTGVEDMHDPHCEKHAGELAEIENDVGVPATAGPDYCQFLDADPAVAATADTGSLKRPDTRFMESLRGPGFRTSVVDVSKHFMKPGLDPDVVQVHLQDLIDDLVGQAVGDGNAYAYLHSCFVAHRPPKFTAAERAASVQEDPVQPSGTKVEL